MPLYNVKKLARTGVAQIGDTMSRGVTKVSTGVAGRYVSHLTTNGLRRSVKTLEMQEMMDDTDIVKDIRIIHKRARRLARFSPDKLRGMYTKNSSHPDSMNKIIAKHVHNFSQDLHEFSEAYANFLQRINDILQREAQKEAIDGQLLLGMLQQWKEIAREKGLIYDPHLLQTAEHEIQRLIFRQTKDRRSELREESRERRTGKVRAGFFSVRGSRIAHKMKKNFRKLNSSEMKDIHANWAQMNQQIAKKQPQQDFPIRFKRHIETLETMERHHHRIHHDVDVLIMTVNKEVMEAWKAMATFLAMFKTFPGVAQSNIPSELKHLTDLKESVEKVLQAGIVDSQRVLHELRAESRQVHELFVHIGELGQDVLQDISNNPEEAFRQQQEFQKAA